MWLVPREAQHTLDTHGRCLYHPTSLLTTLRGDQHMPHQLNTCQEVLCAQSYFARGSGCFSASFPHRLSGAPSIPPMPTQGSAARHRRWDEPCQHFLPARFWAVKNTPGEATDPVPVSHRREISLTCGSGTSPRLLPPPSFYLCKSQHINGTTLIALTNCFPHVGLGTLSWAQVPQEQGKAVPCCTWRPRDLPTSSY